MHRLRAYERQGGRCLYCLLPMYEFRKEEFARLYNLTLLEPGSLKSTSEHLVARQDGGLDSRENVAAACRHCNEYRHHGRAKNAPSPDRFRLEVQALMACQGWHPSGLTPPRPLIPQGTSMHNEQDAERRNKGTTHG